jgi:hypothetical protein
MHSTRTEAQVNALHWAAVALGVKEASERDGKPLSASELGHFERYQDKARDRGFTDADIRDYLTTGLR